MSASPKTQVQNAVAELLKVTDTLIAERNDARMHRDAAMENVNAFSKENARLREEITNLTRGVNANVEQIERLLVAKNALEDMVESMRSTPTVRQGLNKEIDELKNTLAAVRGERDEANAKIEALQHTDNAPYRRNLFDALHKAETERDSMTKRFKNLEADMRGMETLLREERQTKEYLIDQLELKTKAADHLGKLYDEHCEENARLQSVLNAIQTACKGS
jgi:chromosome segregation ATPase